MPACSQAACTSVIGLTRLAGPELLPQALQEPLVLALAAGLGHQHSRVRLASLQAMGALVQHGTPQALLQEHVLPAVLPLAHDHAPAVRATLFSAAARWAGSDAAADDASGEGRGFNRCRAAVPVLLPLLLLGLTDEEEATRSRTYNQLQSVGALMAARVRCMVPPVPVMLRCVRHAAVEASCNVSVLSCRRSPTIPHPGTQAKSLVTAIPSPPRHPRHLLALWCSPSCPAYCRTR